MFEQLEDINTRPKPFEFYTAADLWADEYTSSQMLAYHLNTEIDVSSRKGDPVVSFPVEGRGEGEAFELLVSTLKNLKSKDPVALSGLKDELRKADPAFSEKQYGYGGFLQFVKAATAKGIVEMDFDAESGAYSVALVK